MNTPKLLTLDSLNWEATATIAAGILAVLAAFVIGFRQAGIQSRQVKLEELKIRSDLFDKRFAVYEATAYLLAHINLHIDQTSQDLMTAWLRMLRQSQFLFSSHVHEELETILKYYNSYLLNGKELNASRNYPPSPIKYAALSGNQIEVMRWLSDRLVTVHEIFEADLKLTIPQARRRWRWRSPEKRRG